MIFMRSICHGEIHIMTGVKFFLVMTKITKSSPRYNEPVKKLSNRNIDYNCIKIECYTLKEIYREYRQFSGYISKRVWLTQIQLNCMGVS